MTPLAERFEILLADAERRGLTPKAWWLGRTHHDTVRDTMGDEDRVVVEGPRVVEVDGLPVKVLSESPERFALWCHEGALDL